MGSGRPFYGLQSAVSSTGTDGRLMQTSDTSQFFHVGSGGTAFVGGARSISAGSYPGSVPQRHQWIMEFGAGTTDINGAATVSYPNSGFSGVPVLNVSVVGTINTVIAIQTPTASSFGVVTGDPASGAVGLLPFYWQSVGTRVL